MRERMRMSQRERGRERDRDREKEQPALLLRREALRLRKLHRRLETRSRLRELPLWHSTLRPVHEYARVSG